MSRGVDGTVRPRGLLVRLLPPRAADNPYRHGVSLTYSLGYTLADLGQRDQGTELHRTTEQKGP